SRVHVADGLFRGHCREGRGDALRADKARGLNRPLMQEQRSVPDAQPAAHIEDVEITALQLHRTLAKAACPRDGLGNQKGASENATARKLVTTTVSVDARPLRIPRKCRGLRVVG